MKLFGGSGNKNNRKSPDSRKKRSWEEDDLILTPGEAGKTGNSFKDGSDSLDVGGDESYSKKRTAGEGDAERVIADSAAKKKRRIRGAIIAVAVIAVLVTGGIAWYSNWSQAPVVSGTRPTTHPGTDASPTPSMPGEDPEPEPTDDPNDPRKKGCYTFLIVGLDKMSISTDTIIVGRLDTSNHTLSCISIPRDTLVNVSWGTKRVNTYYNTALANGKSEDEAIVSLKDGIKDLLGFEVDSYAIIDLEAFEKLVDAIGGVDYNVPVDMYYSAPDQNLTIAIPKGEQHLNGEDALKVVRFRSGYATGDIGRIDTQQDFMMTLAKQMLTLGNILKTPTFYGIYEEYVKTDLTTGNLAFYIEEFLKIKSEDITFHTIPANYNGSIKGGSYCFIYVNEWLEMINEYLNPWKEDIVEANLNVLTRTDSGYYSTTGVIAGGADSFVDYNAYIASLYE